jgi:hypothetical protein
MATGQRSKKKKTLGRRRKAVNGERPKARSGAERTSQTEELLADDAHTTGSMHVRKKQHGLLIGVGGATVQQLQHDTGTQIRLDREAETLEISGRVPAVRAALLLVEDLLSKARSSEPTQRSGTKRSSSRGHMDKNDVQPRHQSSSAISVDVASLLEISGEKAAGKAERRCRRETAASMRGLDNYASTAGGSDDAVMSSGGISSGGKSRSPKRVAVRTTAARSELDETASALTGVFDTIDYEDAASGDGEGAPTKPPVPAMPPPPPTKPAAKSTPAPAQLFSPDPPPPPSLAIAMSTIVSRANALSAALQTTPQTGEAAGKQRALPQQTPHTMTTRAEAAAAAAAAEAWANAPVQPLLMRGRFQATEPAEEARARAVAKHREKVLAARVAATEAVRTCAAKRAELDAAVAALQMQIERKDLDLGQLLMTEHVMRPETYGLPAGRLRLDLLSLRKRSGATKMVDGKEVSLLDSVPQQELLAMKLLQDELRANDELYLAAAKTIRSQQLLLASAVVNRGGHDATMVPLPGESLMSWLTRYHDKGEQLLRRKAGRPPQAEAEFQLLWPRKTMYKGRYTVDAIMLSHIMRHRTAKRALSCAHDLRRSDGHGVCVRHLLTHAVSAGIACRCVHQRTHPLRCQSND